jgi:hypothetical protein
MGASVLLSATDAASVAGKNGRASREKQVPRCARNDSQKSKGNSKCKSKGYA